MTRRCSHCNGNGHNCRKCPNGVGGGGGGGGGGSGGGSAGVKLFGVRLTDGSIMKKSASMGNLSHSSMMKKSASMGNLSLYQSSSSAAAPPSPGSPSSDRFGDPLGLRDGYDSDDPVHATSSANPRAERKKGIPWTEEEHRLFLMGLQQIGKGDWRGISKNFVTSRTPTQVASHAQKYFSRKANNSTQKRRRSSLFDMVPEYPLEMSDEQQHGLPPKSTNSSTEELTVHNSQEEDDHKDEPLTYTDLSIKQDLSEPMETTPVGSSSSSSSSSVGQNQQFLAPPFMMPYLTFYPAFVPVPIQMWRPILVDTQTARVSQHQILKPTPIKAVNVDELVDMSNLTLRDSGSGLADSLSLRLAGDTSRQSAFHAQTPPNSGRNIQGEEHN